MVKKKFWNKKQHLLCFFQKISLIPWMNFIYIYIYIYIHTHIKFIWWIRIIYLKKAKYFFWTFFLLCLKFCFKVKIVLSPQKLICFWGYSKWQHIGQCSRLKQKSFNFLVAEKFKPRKIYRKMCDVYGEACLNQQNFMNEQNMS